MKTTEQCDRHITLINVFTVKPEKQATAATKVTEIYQNFVCKQPGFVAAEIYKSLDGTTVSAIARWQSKQDLATMQQSCRVSNFN